MPPMRRRGRPGLMGTMARTAVIAGTATATSNAINNKSQQKAAAQQAAAAQAAPAPEAPVYVVTPQPEAVGPADSDMMDQLTKLAQLHQSGVLTDDEFTAAKAKILAG